MVQPPYALRPSVARQHRGIPPGDAVEGETGPKGVPGAMTSSWHSGLRGDIWQVRIGWRAAGGGRKRLAVLTLTGGCCLSVLGSRMSDDMGARSHFFSAMGTMRIALLI